METNLLTLLEGPIVAINVGLADFAASLAAQEVQVVQVDWVPPAGGDQQMMDLLEALL
jgi:FdrA protein